MIIAVTYEDGNVYQHFGHTEFFKLYEIQGGEIVATQVVGSDGQGHGALAVVLSTYDVALLICGGIGGGAQNALAQMGIAVVSGATGDADEAVKAFLEGKLVSMGTTCHHHEEGHQCGGHEDGHLCGHHDHGEGHHCGGHGNGGCGHGGCCH